MFSPPLQNPIVLVADTRMGLEWLLYGHLTVPYWIVALFVGLAVTAGLVRLLWKLDD